MAIGDVKLDSAGNVVLNGDGDVVLCSIGCCGPCVKMVIAGSSAIVGLTSDPSATLDGTYWLPLNEGDTPQFGCGYGGMCLINDGAVSFTVGVGTAATGIATGPGVIIGAEIFVGDLHWRAFNFYIDGVSPTGCDATYVMTYEISSGGSEAATVTLTYQDECEGDLTPFCAEADGAWKEALTCKGERSGYFYEFAGTTGSEVWAQSGTPAFCLKPNPSGRTYPAIPPGGLPVDTSDDVSDCAADDCGFNCDCVIGGHAISDKSWVTYQVRQYAIGNWGTDPCCKQNFTSFSEFMPFESCGSWSGDSIGVDDVGDCTGTATVTWDGTPTTADAFGDETGWIVTVPCPACTPSGFCPSPTLTVGGPAVTISKDDAEGLDAIYVYDYGLDDDGNPRKRVREVHIRVINNQCE